MDWEIIEKVTNHPVFIAFISIVAIVGGGFVILSQTSVGRKLLNKLSDAINKIKEKTDLVQKQLGEVKKECQEKLDSVQKTTESFIKDYENKFTIVVSQYEFFEDAIFQIISQIPNEKVQKQLNDFYLKWQEKKQQIKESFGETYIDLKEQMKGQLTSIKNELSEIDSLKGEIEKLKELLNEKVNAKENAIYGETKGTSNEEAGEE